MEKCSYQIPLGYSSPGGSRHGVLWDLRGILSGQILTGTIRFHLGYIGESVRLQITRSFFFGLHQTNWEVLGPIGTLHRFSNGATVLIGKQIYTISAEPPVTTVAFARAPLMWKRAIPAVV